METKSQSVSFDPRTKLLLLITVSGILVQGKMEGMLIGVNLCMLAVPLLFFWMDKRYKKTIKYGLIFLTGVILELGILPRLTGQSAVLAAAVVYAKRDHMDAVSRVSIFPYCQGGIGLHAGCNLYSDGRDKAADSKTGNGIGICFCATDHVSGKYRK